MTPDPETREQPWMHWAVAIALWYFLALVVLTGPVLFFSFSGVSFVDSYAYLRIGWFWLWAGLMVGGQVLLLRVPVRVANRRPVTRRSVLLPIAVSGLMMAALVVGAFLSLHELIYDGTETGLRSLWIPLGLMGGLWLVWTVIFFCLSLHRGPLQVVAEQTRLLLKGSVLELLVAVPCHILVRQRGYCCAGMFTFVGIALGIPILLLSFGPAVFLLFYARYQSLRARYAPLPLSKPTLFPPESRHEGPAESGHPGRLDETNVKLPKP